MPLTVTTRAQFFSFTAMSILTIDEVFAFFSSEIGRMQVNRFRIVEVRVCIAVIEWEVCSVTRNLYLEQDDRKRSNKKLEVTDRGTTTLNDGRRTRDFPISRGDFCEPGIYATSKDLSTFAGLETMLESISLSGRWIELLAIIIIESFEYGMGLFY